MKKIIGTIISISTIALFVFLGVQLLTNTHAADDNIQYIDYTYAFNISDIDQMTYHTDNVFVGYVTEELYSTDISEGNAMPITYYKLTVVDNIKGQIVGEVILKNYGGYT